MENVHKDWMGKDLETRNCLYRTDEIALELVIAFSDVYLR